MINIWDYTEFGKIQKAMEGFFFYSQIKEAYSIKKNNKDSNGYLIGLL